MGFKHKIGCVILRVLMLPMNKKEANRFLDSVAARTSEQGKAIVEHERLRVAFVFDGASINKS
jgi:hypothetical protein